MYLLHWEYMAGSIVVQAMLEEIGADYGLRHVDMSVGEHREPEYLRLNPAGRVPALTLPGGATIGETGAIVTLLGEEAPKAALTPRPGTPERAAFLFWLNVMATAGYLTVSRKCHPERFAGDPAAIDQVEVVAASDLEAFFDMMEAAILGAPFFLECGYTALDLYLAMLTEWSEDRDALFSCRPRLSALCSRVSGRPAYETALRTHRVPEEVPGAG